MTRSIACSKQQTKAPAKPLHFCNVDLTHLGFPDGSGLIEFNEFVLLVKQMNPKPPPEEGGFGGFSIPDIQMPGASNLDAEPTAGAGDSLLMPLLSRPQVSL